MKVDLEEIESSLAAKKAAADNNERQRLMQLERNAEARLKASNITPTPDKIEAMVRQMEQEEMQRKMNEAAARQKRKPLAGGSFPDLTGDGKVTQADILKGRGIFNTGGLSNKDMKNIFASRASEIVKLLNESRSSAEKTEKELRSMGDELDLIKKTKKQLKKDYDLNKHRLAEGSMMMPTEGMPVDTYDNIPADEIDEVLASQLPDDEMEEDYIKYVMDESLNDEEQMYLAGALQDDDRLSDILDKVIATASEFSGAGEVDGPGTGVSDSIPARLSDGEFVFTKKATDQIGAENLQRMMDDAERAYDGGVMMAEGGMMDEEDPGMSKTKEEIEKLMMGANRMPSLR